MTCTIQIRVDDALKQQSDSLFRDLGTDTTSAIRMFLHQAIACKGFPFEIKKAVPNPYNALSEEELLERLEIARFHADQGKVRDADEAIADLRRKYGV